MSEDTFETLLEHLRQSRGFDFAAYKRSSLKRRIDKRMQMVGLTGYDAYLDHLEVHQDEFPALFNTILINVTSFFRDPTVWQHLADDVIPGIINSKHREDPIRLWSAACASGEEAYSLAILLAEVLGPDAFRERVKIYATDVDEEALTEARQAVFTARHVEGVDAAYLAKYFDRINGNYVFDKELRRSVIFGRHDLIQDAPISRVDLIACRNALMYFNAETQTRVVGRFYYGLNDGGVLVLGKAEMLFDNSAMFQSVDLKHRIFRATPKLTQRDRLLLLAQGGRDEVAPAVLTHARMRDAAFDTDPMAQIVVDSEGTLALVNEQARRQFGLSIRDLGRPIQDLELSYRPADLRSIIDQVTAGTRQVTLKNVEAHTAPGELTAYDILAYPLIDHTGLPLGVRIAFADITQLRRLEAELQTSKQELETAYEELQSTNEELETTNEELQSTVEELETTNEELQSTNEELETMNEELQSTNEELQTMNEELRNRGGELNELNAFLGSILRGFRAGVAVVNRNLEVQVWNERAEDLWGVRQDEVRGIHMLNLDIGLPVQGLAQPIRHVLSGADGSEVAVLQSTDRRGRGFRCRVTCTALHGGSRDVTGVILIMEDQRELAEVSSSLVSSSPDSDSAAR
jgi:two-component system CheB/CheR fusion protein